MILAIISILAALGGGILFTYVYDDDIFWQERIIEGSFIGMVLFGLVGFIFASLIKQITVPAIIITSIIIFFLPAVYVYSKKKNLFFKDLHIVGKLNKFFDKPNKNYFPIFYFGIFITILGVCLVGAMEEKDGVIYTRSIDNYADLTLHTGIITGFAYGNNFPPQHPDFSGTRLTYPFLIDFAAAMLVVGGLTMAQAMWLQNFILLTLLIFLLYFLAKALTKSNFSAYLTPMLFFAAGGLGWTVFIKEAAVFQGNFWEFLSHLPHDYTAIGDNIRFDNPLVYWFIPMRSMVLGIPLFLVVINIWWRVLGKKIPPKSSNNLKLMLAAGFVTGLLPLVHTHSFLVLIFTGFLLCLIFKNLRDWLIYFFTAVVTGLPQLFYLFQSSVTKADKFFGFIPGWNTTTPKLFEFWFNNTGLFIPLLILALITPKLINKKLKLFFLPFLTLFIIPNFVRFAPWEWDNIKILAYWYVLSVPIIGYLLGWWWKKSWPVKLTVILLITSMILSGFLDIWRVISRNDAYAVYDNQVVKTAEFIKSSLPRRSVILTAPLHTNPVLLTGRQSFMGYAGRLWTHGIDYYEREQQVKNIYQGIPETKDLLIKNKIDYIILGPQERYWAKEQNIILNENFFSGFDKIICIEETCIYKVN